MHVVATAGHVDHGKSTLVRALTGQEPDRLAEEHRRGLSIELGYAWTEIAGAGDVAFVDVPGHERFLSTTLAGLGPVSVAMLVVAADDPWMPQAAEHLAAIDALGVRHGVLVVTRSDLADPAPTVARARVEVERTSLAGCPDVVVSGRTGVGLDDLRSTLASVLMGVLGDPDAPVRLWVDRVFAVAGAGRVVTGTLPAGTVRTGDTLALGSRSVRVRGIETLGRAVTEVEGPARVALRLGGRSPDGLRRGSVLVAPHRFADVTEVDVRHHGPGTPPEQPLLHIGTASMTVHARPLGEHHVRLRLDHPLPLRHGERVVLRDPGSRTLWGADVLDAAPPSLVRRGAARLRAAELEGFRPDLAGEVARRGVVRRSALDRLGVDTRTVPAGATALDDWLVSAEQVRAWRAALVEEIRDAPDGRSPSEAARAIGVPDPDLLPLVTTPPLTVRGGRLVVDAGLSERLRVALDAIRRDLAQAPFRAPDTGRLAELGVDLRDLARLARDGHLLSLGDGIVLLPGADLQAYEILAALGQPFSTSQARQALHTSRRVVLSLLGHLDRAGFTVRLPDDSRRVRETLAGR
jgi:selenocysteine-specific elongation factor